MRKRLGLPAYDPDRADGTMISLMKAADTEAPGRDRSPTMRSFSAAFHRRRRATPVITSTRS